MLILILAKHIEQMIDRSDNASIHSGNDAHHTTVVMLDDTSIDFRTCTSNLKRSQKWLYQLHYS